MAFAALARSLAHFQKVSGQLHSTLIVQRSAQSHPSPTSPACQVRAVVVAETAVLEVRTLSLEVYVQVAVLLAQQASRTKHQ